MSEAKPASSPTTPGSTRALVALLAFVLGFATIPHRVCERDAAKWYRGDRTQTEALAASVAAWTTHPPSASSFATGSSRFDGEWLFVTYMMAAMGFGQAALELPEPQRAPLLDEMERSLDLMLEPHVRAFDMAAWQGDAMASVQGGELDRGHVGFLGYAGLALALHRVHRPESRFADREESIIAALARRIEASDSGFVETYPGELYPVDNTAAFAALAVHAAANKQPAAAALMRGLDAIKSVAIDAETGLLFQAVLPGKDAKPRDGARASGTALAVYFLSFADPALSRSLFRALERRQYRTVLGFGGMMEYPPGAEAGLGTLAPGRRGRGDVDSGPVVLGFGVSASGFALGASRVHADRDMFTALYATAHLFGAPLDEDGKRTYVTGGPIGDAILFAMLTAPRAGSIA